MYTPLATYSFSMSFWTVPLIADLLIPCSSAIATYIASRVVAGALMVIELDTEPRSIELNKALMSCMLSIATPTLPTSPSAFG